MREWVSINDVLRAQDEAREVEVERPSPYAIADYEPEEHHDCGVGDCDEWRATGAAIDEHRARAHRDLRPRASREVREAQRAVSRQRYRDTHPFRCQIRRRGDAYCGKLFKNAEAMAEHKRLSHGRVGDRMRAAFA